MKLLFDQHLSPKLVVRLADLFPGSAHVQDVRLDHATDEQLWAFAVANQYTVVSKDADFNQLSVLKGFPPKVIWLLLGNCTTAQVEKAFRDGFAEIIAFEGDGSAGTLILS